MSKAGLWALLASFLHSITLATQILLIQVPIYISNFKENTMKKLLLMAALSMLAMTSHARETVTLLYSWTAGDNAANFYRALADEANRIQDQYQFLFDTRPGAGGTVAANQTLQNPNSILWINSSAGFIRPNLFPRDSHNMENFRSILPMCVSPFVIASNRYSSWRDVPRDAKLSIGMSGLGTTTHLVSIQIAKNFPNMTIVPFKSTSEALLGVLSGNVDFSVGFHGDSEQYTRPGAVKTIHWLGQTGRESIKGTQLLSNQGFSRELADMSTPQQIFAGKTMSDTRFREVRKILVEASRAKTVRDANAADNCVPNNQMPDDQLDTWFNSQVSQWRRLTQGVKLD
jgi:tripartite-type tricarboxylate transporter receptor subunit TctC